MSRTLRAIRPLPRNLWWSIYRRHESARLAMLLFVAWWRGPPDGCLELRQLARGAWEWLGADETRRPLVRAGKA